ncbi:Protein CBG27130 [Caenorhabditis briggsae]|uniref:Protein CBG27130 n=1 Tax=Caenorhabditis briggsae TaxID=6238 RepID=B6IHK4_CAEBR|nr:Protein CBG27130 [Caenorhabditis briggsae]CAR99384.1 Protein CBG27130 [Caenorhabditis briggsae]
MSHGITVFSGFVVLSQCGRPQPEVIWIDNNGKVIEESRKMKVRIFNHSKPTGCIFCGIENLIFRSFQFLNSVIEEHAMFLL